MMMNNIKLVTKFGEDRTKFRDRQTDKPKILVNNKTSTGADISMNDKKLEEVTCFRNFGENLYKDGASASETEQDKSPGITPCRRMENLIDNNYVAEDFCITSKGNDDDDDDDDDDDNDDDDDDDVY
ncbi:hypothetical protein DPMN_160514 [Dreissena polymorpha]|uniref:Uncharacterized protein n=1 Tax=Dreissena polymorpha TaxID=45954 RepID=A0A9D4ERD3_DREPO|nr:hypothetical protein DPMN_160514 [Dreissena polymorpha]